MQRPGSHAPAAIPRPDGPAAAGSPAAENPETYPVGAAEHRQNDAVYQRGAALFARQCSVCHGDAGDGQGPFAYLMNPKPRDLRSGLSKTAMTENQIPTDADLERTIAAGMPGSAMPPWGHLPRADLQALVRFVRTLHVDAVHAALRGQVADGQIREEALESELQRRTTPGPPVRIPAEPGFDDIAWFHGRRLYIEACSACHGMDGRPDPTAIKTDVEGYPVPPRSFVQGIFKGGAEGDRVFTRILKGVPGTAMPAYEGVYTDDELWHLTHYVQSLAQAGAQQRTRLRQGTIVASRVHGPLPSDPMDSAWSQAQPVYVALTPLWWSEQRIEGVTVEALHDGEEIALRLSWLDATRDDRAVRQGEFRDAIAVQFSLSPDPPFYMGTHAPEGGVNIWMWKADRQTGIDAGHQDVDTAFPDFAVDYYPEREFPFDAPPPQASSTGSRSAVAEHDALFLTGWGAGNPVANPRAATPVEALTAQGPGTLHMHVPAISLVKGRGVYERGIWHVQMQRVMQPPVEADAARDDPGRLRTFRRGDYLPVSFAVFDGSAGDRDGKKNISIWQKLIVE